MSSEGADGGAGTAGASGTGGATGPSKPPRGADLPEEYLRLEATVRRLVDEAAGYRARAQVAERQAAELERTMRELHSGALDPVELKDAVRRLEEENQELRQRMVRAQDRIRRLVARFDFLREEM